MKKIIALAIVIAVLVASYSAAWLWAAGQATAYMKTLETADGVSMPRVVCGTLGIGGFPFGFDATCTNATIESADLTVTVSGIKAAIEVYRPTHVLMFAQGPVTIQDAFTGSRSRVDFVSAEGSARLTGWRIGRVSAVIDAPVWNDTVLEDRLIAKAERVEAHLLDIPERYDGEKGLASLAHYAEIAGLDAPGFDIAAGRATLEAEITSLPDDVRTYGDADLLRRWQAAGGKLELTGFKGDDASSRFDVSGTIGLDSGGRAEGQVKLSSSGVVERLGDAVPAQFQGLILGGRAADGSYSQTLNIAAGVVFSGLVPTAVIPPLF